MFIFYLVNKVNKNKNLKNIKKNVILIIKLKI